MPLLIRRINRAKWECIEANDVSADAITNCLKTYQNDLSVWRINSETELDDAILALITGAKQTKLSTLHYVIINEEIVTNKGLNLKTTLGDTSAECLKEKHRDISNLTYTKLGIIKDIILESIRKNDSNFLTKVQLRKLIKEAIESGKLLKEKLNPELVENEKL